MDNMGNWDDMDESVKNSLLALTLYSLIWFVKRVTGCILLLAGICFPIAVFFEGLSYSGVMDVFMYLLMGMAGGIMFFCIGLGLIIDDAEMVCIGIFLTVLLFLLGSLGSIGEFFVILCGVICFIYLLDRRKRHFKEAEEREREKKEREERLRIEREEFERTQKGQGLVKFVSHDGKEKWGTPEQVKEWKELDIGLSNNFADYTPREFEKFVCDLFRNMGYNVELTPASGDYGIDVVAKSLETPLQFRLKNMLMVIWWVHR